MVILLPSAEKDVLNPNLSCFPLVPIPLISLPICSQELFICSKTLTSPVPGEGKAPCPLTATLLPFFDNFIIPPNSSPVLPNISSPILTQSEPSNLKTLANPLNPSNASAPEATIFPSEDSEVVHPHQLLTLEPSISFPNCVQELLENL